MNANHMAIIVHHYNEKVPGKVLPQMKTHITFDTKNISLIPFKHTYHRNIPHMSQICQ